MKKVTAVLLFKENKILIAKRKANQNQGNKWEFPGGKVEKNETPEECLKREIYEEFGIIIKVNSFYCSSIYAYEFGTIELMTYWADYQNGNLIPTVHDEYKWTAIENLHEYDFSPADIPIVNKLIKDYT